VEFEKCVEMAESNAARMVGTLAISDSTSLTVDFLAAFCYDKVTIVIVSVLIRVRHEIQVETRKQCRLINHLNQPHLQWKKALLLCCIDETVETWSGEWLDSSSVVS
jgi:hypothetical protein